MKAFHEVRSYRSNYSLWHSTYQDISFLAHWHNEIELILLRTGSSSISVNDRTFEAQQGDLIICNSGDIHYSDAANQQNTIDFIVFDPALLGQNYPSLLCPQHLIPGGFLQEHRLIAPLDHLIETIDAELDEKQLYYQEIITAALREFWFRLRRCIPDEPSDVHLQGQRSEFLYAFHQLLGFLEEHFSEDIPLETAASMIGYSTGYFSKTFKRLIGINYITYLNMLRIEHAVSCLQSSSDKIIDIALQCGFHNIRTFNRTFREITGYSPTEFLQHSSADSFSLTYYQRRSSEQKLAQDNSPTIINNQC